MFTPIHTFAGGLLLHLSTASLLDNNGRVFGGSSILYEAIYGDHAPWRWILLGGMLIAPKLNAVFQPLASLLLVHAPKVVEPVPDVDSSVLKLIIAGCLVGFGSKLGSGCTSGHFLCGVSRLSPRSLVATMTFFSIAVLTAFLSASTTGPALANGAIPSYTPLLPTSAEFVALVALLLAHFTLHHTVSRLPARTSALKKTLIALLSGLTFATGLQLSGMSRPIKVLRFLHLPIPGLFSLAEWDPSLFMVVLGGIVPNAIHYRFRVRPALEEQERNTQAKKTDEGSWSRNGHQAVAPASKASVKYYLPNKIQSAKIDTRLVTGAAIFGLGWGMTGTCLLPSVVNAGNALFGLTPTPGSAVAFMASVIAGLGLGGLV
ncbi:hypothetical protein QFC20_001289 [Naganishia adeliensis]|uniref:Uncharacterized protein n=1 Tax=Naganishia adeliensis TaxID=92952 RepID=A0ACC2WUX0_9TREE|nr:hypothetical protein QFC20_001289 [Naganishia adeliensis]